MSEDNELDSLHYDDDDSGFEVYGSSTPTPQKEEELPTYKLNKEDSPGKAWIANKGLRDQQPIESDEDDPLAKWDKFKM